MLKVERRGFLKVLSAILGTAAIATYVEPIFTFQESYSDWIEDKGDFFIVRVPDFKKFSGETLDNPTIFILGQKSTVSDVVVNGYANISAQYGGRVLDSRFDASKMTTQNPREVVKISGTSFVLDGCGMYGNRNTAGIGIESLTS